MKRILKFLEQYVIRPLEKLSKQRHLNAIRNGIMAAFPISLIGSFFYVLTVLPFPQDWAIQKFLTANSHLILIPYRVTTLILSLYIVVGVGSGLAKYYKYSPVSGSIISLVTFFMTVIPLNPSSAIPADFKTNAAASGLDVSWLDKLDAIGWVIPIEVLGATSAFLGVLSAIVGVEIMHLSKYIHSRTKRKKKIANIEIPSSLLNAISDIAPIAVIVLLLFFVRDVLNLNFQAMIDSFFTGLIKVSNSLPGALLFSLLMSFILFLGMQGFSVSGGAVGRAFKSLLRSNKTAQLSGNPLPNIAPMPFYQWFIWIGGTGSTLSLVVLMCFSKSKYLKNLGRSCLLPSIFNINDPVVYGAPVMLNPYMAIPFVLGPVVTTFFSYIVMALGIVSRPYNAPLANLPAPVGAFLATGDWKAIVLCLVNILISILIYFPFFKMYEEKLISTGEARARKIALDENKPLHTTSVD